MTTATDVAAWVDLYRTAWESNLADDIRAVLLSAYREVQVQIQVTPEG